MRLRLSLPLILAALLATVARAELQPPASYYGDTTVSYQDPTADLHRRIEELERIVAQMPGGGRASLVSDSNEAAAEMPSQGHCNRCGQDACCCDPYHIGSDFLSRTCRTGGFIGGAEVVFLKPFATNGDLPGSFPLDGTSADFRYEATPRFWIGYMHDSGLGSQFRYWEFDHDVGGIIGDDPNDLINGALEFRTCDWELLQRVDFRRWNFQFSGGIRYAEINIDEQVTFFNSSILRSSFLFGSGFDGVGLTGGVQASRALTPAGNLQMVAAGRGSVLFGNRKYFFDVEFASVDLFDFDTRNDNDLVGIYELTVGPRYQRRLANGAVVFIGGGFEGQLWQGSGTAFSDPFDTSLGNIGFAGLGFNLGFMR